MRTVLVSIAVVSSGAEYTLFIMGARVVDHTSPVTYRTPATHQHNIGHSSFTDHVRMED